jgi:integrase
MKIPEPRKLQSGNYFIQLRLNGVSVPVSAATARECKDAAAIIKAEYRAGKRTITKSKDSPTLKQAIDNYINQKDNTLSPATIRGYKGIQNNRFKSVMDKKLKDIADWQKICNDEARIISAKTLKNSWGLIVSILGDNGLIVPKITLPQVVHNERPWLDYEQILVFIKDIKGKSGELAALLALSSLRRSEICALTPKNIDIAHSLIVVKGAKVLNKNHKYVVKATNKNKTSQRNVPILIPRLLELLSADFDTDYLISVRPDTLCNQINRTCAKVGLPLVGVHGLRHSFASLAYHLGMPEKECMRIGGWSDAKTMHDIYTHLADRDNQKYADAMRDFYKKANENANENKKTLELQGV